MSGTSRPVVFIAGGGDRLEICRAFSEKGYYVSATFSGDKSELGNVVQFACGAGDLTPSDLSSAIVDTAEQLGGIDAAVWAMERPSGGDGWDKMLLDLDASDWDSAMSRGARGAFLMCKFALPYLISRPGARIIFLEPDPISDNGRDVAEETASRALDALAGRLTHELSVHGIKVERCRMSDLEI